MNGSLAPIALDADGLEALTEQLVAQAAERIFQAHQGGLAVARAWVYRRKEQVAKYGDRASWYVGWISPDGKREGKSCGPGKDGRRNAGKLKRKIEAELLTGTYQTNANKPWEEFRKEYDQQIIQSLAPRTQDEINAALDTFQRICSTGKVNGITTATIDRFRTARRAEPSQRTPGELVSVATVNKELRHLRAALKKACRWKFW